mmetsp:Transcript_137100/g.292827  ORF Transcript_137100/g.292827 Transcript_137100/m.292827 type:complete len:506 (-) Transcript_137100:17-1534(-)
MARISALVHIVWLCHSLWLLAVTAAFGAAQASAPHHFTGSFTVYSAPVELRYGEVHNRVSMVRNGTQEELLPLPADVVARYRSGDKLMAISGFDIDMVRVHADGSESQVLLSDHYLHHYALYFGETQVMKDMFAAAASDKHLAHLLTGCRSMTGAGVRYFQHRLQEKEKWVGFGSAAGSEYRHNPQRFQAPYRMLLQRPEGWTPLLHIINTNSGDKSPEATSNTGDPTAGHSTGISRLTECPCSPQRKINVTNGTIDGKNPDPPIQCSPEFKATGNPSCSLSTYVGGWRCCEDGMFLIDTDKECKLPGCLDKPLDKMYMKATFYYEDAQPNARRIEPSACCDATSDHMGNENIEYDVPACAAGTPPDQCVYVVEAVQPIGYYYPDASAWPRPFDLVDLVFAAPHLHWTGMSMELIDHETNKTICEVHRTEDNSAGLIYGKGHEAGDEDEYLVGLIPCVWNVRNATRFRRDHLLRSRAVYNARTNHTGVMGLWLMNVAAVSDEVLI